MSEEVDVRELAAMLRAKRGTKGLRAVAEEIGGVSASTLSRVEQGNIPDLDTFLKICRWIGISPDRFARNKGEISAVSTPDILAAHLRADSTLKPETAEALAEMIRVLYSAAARGELPTGR